LCITARFYGCKNTYQADPMNFSDVDEQKVLIVKKFCLPHPWPLL
jgi:hypothetical protein